MNDIVVKVQEQIRAKYHVWVPLDYINNILFGNDKLSPGGDRIFTTEYGDELTFYLSDGTLLVSKNVLAIALVE